MKIRIGFVSNSSSTSFVISDGGCRDVQEEVPALPKCMRCGDTIERDKSDIGPHTDPDICNACHLEDDCRMADD